LGACLPLRDDDYRVGNHRSHGYPIAKGADLAPLMAELMGRHGGRGDEGAGLTTLVNMPQKPYETTAPALVWRVCAVI
jgi:TPP-dependent pyruvate/acetoin dehydrogenase alpha subunit